MCTLTYHIFLTFGAVRALFALAQLATVEAVTAAEAVAADDDDDVAQPAPTRKGKVCDPYI